MSTLAVRAAIAAHYRALLPGVTVLEHGGPMTLEELKRWTAQAPALIVACLGWPHVGIEGGMSVGDAAFAIFAVTRTSATSDPTLERGGAAMTLAEFICADLPVQRWGNLASKMPKSIGATNLYSTAIDQVGAALWVVRWSQGCDMLNVTTASLADFLRACSTWAPSAPVDATVIETQTQVTLAADTALAIVLPVPVPVPVVGVAYSLPLTGVGGNHPNYAWTVSVGSLPANLALGASTGLISGTPSTPGASTFTVLLTDSLGATASAVITLTVGAAP